ncbi:hypothetical protein NFI96_026548, partial [Prochilodus magdalenae]
LNSLSLCLSPYPSKTELLFIPSTTGPHCDLAISFGNSLIAPTEDARSLGVILDGQLSFSAHIANLTRSCRFLLYNIRRIRPFLSQEATQLLVQSLVISRLDYCSSLLAGLPLRAIRPLQLVQNAAARLIFNLPKFTHVTPLLRSLHWLPVVARIRFKTLMPTKPRMDQRLPTFVLQIQTDGFLGGFCSVVSCSPVSAMFPSRVVKSLLSPSRAVSVWGKHAAVCSRMQHSQSVQGDSGAPFRPETSMARTMLDIGTRRIFSEEHDLFRENVRRFFREEVVPHHAEWEKAGQVSREVWEKAGSQGLLGVYTPAEQGGVGGDLLSAAIVWEEQMYCNCSGPGFSLHSEIVMPYIGHYGSQAQMERYFPQMTAGKCIGAIAMTEPGAGSDLQGVRTNARKDGSDWILNGNKVFITNGWMSDLVLVVAVTNREAKTAAHGLSLFLVENGTKGFQKGRKLDKLGLKAQVGTHAPAQAHTLLRVWQDTAELFFEDVRLPADALLGEANKGFYYLMNELPQERLIIAVMAMASCEFMFEETRSYVRQRKAFGKTIADLQTVQHKLAELKTEICVGRAFIDNCLQLHSERKLDSGTASMAKYWASELQNKVATQCLQLHGGWGYMWEFPIAKAFADARVQPIYGGTNEIMKELIARPIVSQK